MIISRNNKPKFKLQTAYDTLTSRLRGLGYDVDGNIELDTSGYGHGWIKVLRNGRKNNFIYMCSHSDNVDPLCCEPVYRYIKVYNYCDDPKDSNLLGEIPFVVSNIDEIPGTEVYKDDEYKVYKDNASDIVWGYMNLDKGYAAQAPWTSYPTTLKDLSGSDLNNSVPVFDIVDNKGYKNSDGTVSAFDNVFTDDDVLYVGKSKEVKTLYTWTSAISGTVTSESLYNDVNYTVCPYCYSTDTACEHCHPNDEIKIAKRYGIPVPPYIFTEYIPLTDGFISEVEYDGVNESLIDGRQLSIETLKNGAYTTGYKLHYQLCVERISDNDFIINYTLHEKGEPVSTRTADPSDPDATKVTFDYKNSVMNRTLIKTLSQSEWTEVTDTFSLNNISNITVKFKLPPTKDLVEAIDIPRFFWDKLSSGDWVLVSLSNKKTNLYLHAYMKDHKDLAGAYENIMVHVNDNNSNKAEILNYMLHSKVKTFEYSPKYSWNYDEIMNFILYKDENLPVMPSRNGIYHLKTNYYNDLTNNYEISKLENVIDGNTCMHLGNLGDNEMHTDYYVVDDEKSDVSYRQALPYLKKPFENRYNYFPNNDVYNVQYWKTPKPGFFEGIYQFNNDYLDAKPNKYVWLTMNYKKVNNYQDYYDYEGNIDTAEIRKPETDKKWEWQGNFHNFLTQREVKSIYYKESFSAHDDLSACSALYYEENKLVPTLSNEPLLTSPYNNIAWNGVSGYRHICKTCSGIGMINPYHHDNWTDNDCIPDDYANIQNIGCPTCGRTGVQTRYLYYKHKYIKSLESYGYKLTELFDNRVANGNQILLDDTLVDGDIKKDLIIYASSAAPVAYYQAGPWGSDEIRYSPSFLGANQMYNYADVELNENEKPKFITKWTDIPGWNKMSSIDQENTKKQWFKRLYRVINAPDTFVQYYVFRGYDNVVKRDIWARIFFDKKWIEKQYFEKNTLENPNQYRNIEMVVNRGDHNHNHVSENTYNLTDSRAYPYFSNTNMHDKRYELDYRKNGVLLQHVCPVCDGEGTIQTAKTDTNGEIIYDIMGNPVMIDVPCPSCNGNGYLEDKHREDYNTAKCSTCDNTGSIPCPRCLKTGITYEAQEGYTLERIVENPATYSSDPSRLKIVLEFHFKRENEDEQIRFFKYVPIKIGSGTQYRPEPIDVITAGSTIEEGSDLYEYVKSVDCPNCTPYKDRLETGYIPCPECGGTFKQGNTYYRIAPGEEDTKKVYKYISDNAVSIDNISVEMDNG